MILMLGDVHGDVRHLLSVIKAEEPDAIIFLGDIESPIPFEEFIADLAVFTEVWWIHGNHDTDSRESYSNLFESALAGRNLHGRVVDIAGLRVAGLGGGVSRPDLVPARESVLSLFRRVGRQQIQAQEGVDRGGAGSPQIPDSFAGGG